MSLIYKVWRKENMFCFLYYKKKEKPNKHYKAAKSGFVREAQLNYLAIQFASLLGQQCDSMMRTEMYTKTINNTAKYKNA